MGIEPGDKLLAINGNEIQDVFDYYYYEESEELLLLIKNQMESSGSWRSKKMRMKVWGLIDQPDGRIPFLQISVCSVLLTRCQKECGKRCILKMMIPDCRFCRETISR